MNFKCRHFDKNSSGAWCTHEADVVCNRLKHMMLLYSLKASVLLANSGATRVNEKVNKYFSKDGEHRSLWVKTRSNIISQGRVGLSSPA